MVTGSLPHLNWPWILYTTYKNCFSVPSFTGLNVTLVPDHLLLGGGKGGQSRQEDQTQHLACLQQLSRSSLQNCPVDCPAVPCLLSPGRVLIKSQGRAVSWDRPSRRANRMRVGGRGPVNGCPLLTVVSLREAIRNFLLLGQTPRPLLSFITTPASLWDSSVQLPPILPVLFNLKRLCILSEAPDLQAFHRIQWCHSEFRVQLMIRFQSPINPKPSRDDAEGGGGGGAGGRRAGVPEGGRLHRGQGLRQGQGPPRLRRVARPSGLVSETYQRRVWDFENLDE